MAESSGGSKKLLWIMVVLVLLSSIGAAAAIYMVMSQDKNAGGNAAAQEVAVRQTPIFLKVEPFTVNLAGDRTGSRLLYTGITLRVGDEQSKEILAEHMPQVRSRLLLLLSNKQASELATPDGKEQLSQSIIARLNKPFAENQPDLDLREVLFTEFIVQ
ncbi:flagellar basal body-associated protein FliL [Vreelandella subglaciescola]|jgi:flagellar FliL protein|uniref:Flagellar protein FliL n=1 Tax=Vreelandella subglaciescola TaxID=29571 RepID=A0A1M7HFN6_9GAMM|nr:flagellar basal body-associated protein FliL [Halomonas subglaciescola]SHM27248.1 flagellar FliL protein [Halomonas subglaciescola]